MIKAHYDLSTGKIIGFYPDDINYKTIPTPNIEITELEWKNCINNSDKYIVKNGKLKSISKPVVDIEALRKNKELELNSLANSTIVNKYPIHTQINVALDEDFIEFSKDYKLKMKSFINSIRNKTSEYKSIINNATVEELQSLQFVFNEL